MKKIILTSVVMLASLLFNTEVKAQDYKHGIGIHFGINNSASMGLDNGITYKITSDLGLGIFSGFEAILGFSSGSRYSTVRFTGLWETHHSLEKITPNLFWYYGLGASLGSQKDNKKEKRDLLLSADAALGLDYKFEKAPINLSLDWRPGFNITPTTYLDGGGLNLSVRYTF